MAVLIIERAQIERTSSSVFGAEEGNGVRTGRSSTGYLSRVGRRLSSLDDVARYDCLLPIQTSSSICNGRVLIAHFNPIFSCQLTHRSQPTSRLRAPKPAEGSQ